MAVVLNTSKDFHKVGYTYAFFWWGLFALYCIAYQIDRFLVYRARLQLSQGKPVSKPFSLFALLNPLKPLGDYVTQIPFVTTWMPVKHIIGVSLFSIINVLWILFAPFKLVDGKTWADVMSIGLMDRRAAYVGMVNWSFVFILGSRNNVVTRMSGMTFEGLVPFHRWLARIGFAEYMPHFVWRIIHGYRHNYIVKDALFRNIEQGTGTIAMIGFLFLFVFSFEWIRRNHFEIFYYTHIFGIIVAIIASCWHETGCFYYFIPAVLLWAFDRIWRSFQSWSVKTKIVNVEAYNSGSKHGITRVLFEYSRLSQYHPGQYMFVTLVNKTKRAFWNYANWHPMTISEDIIIKKASEKTQTTHEEAAGSSSSTGSSSHDSNSFTNATRRRRSEHDQPAASIHIKALGSYTTDLLHSATGHHDLDLKVDGPYGPRLEYQDYKTMACFAAGIGITPALTLIKDCAERRAAGVDTVVTEQVHLVWAIRTLDELTPFTDLIIFWTEQCQRAANPFQLNLDIYVTREVPTDGSNNKRHWIEDLEHCNVTFNQRPDIAGCMDHIEATATDTNSVWVHTCGSDDFMRLIMNQAIKHHWDVHHETFEF
ncbi:ferric reductase like transmembrane component-domain-containing protein [Zychaea mexicana]|uniref:ferric reductase like transmembrane component-domain-containing protein n=1 Tax=Zychaea mexicana TaxID=64656 RepID=UPI0022FDBA53|nr:ferric reductase like transmembrane component-domain-containing protein [Zychaea mexicana]KAI9490520.1 ferric reductase like transmembrane component-domain-containing protein [Zychaea mexicana]